MKGTYKKDDKNFNEALDWLKDHYFHNAGGTDAEVIINWNKREAKEDGVVSLYATNSVICNAIKRWRPCIQSVEIMGEGATLYFDLKSVRPLHTVLKVISG